MAIVSEPPDPANLASQPPGIPQYGLDYVPDIDFAVKDPAIIVSEVIADYQAAYQLLTNIAKTLAPGDPVRLFLLVVCHWLSHQRVIIDFTGKMNLLKYAHDDYLDNLAALYGQRTLRLQAAASLVTVQFTLTTPLVFLAVIPAGTLVQAPSGLLFSTLADCPIAGGATGSSVQAQCTTVGAAGNGFVPGQINVIVNWNQPWGVTVTNTDTSNGGADQETDDQYRYRIWLAIESFSTCGPQRAYEFWARSTDPSIIQAVVYSAPAIAGEVWIYPLVTDATGVPQPASPEICAKVLAMCSATSRRPVSDYVSVFPPTEVPFVLNFDYYVSSENEVVSNQIQAAVNQAANDWILWQRSFVSRDLNCDELIRRCLEAGAKRIVINSPSPEFQPMAYNQMAVLDTTVVGNPTVNYAGLEDP